MRLNWDRQFGNLEAVSGKRHSKESGGKGGDKRKKERGRRVAPGVYKTGSDILGVNKYRLGVTPLPPINYLALSLSLCFILLIYA